MTKNVRHTVALAACLALTILTRADASGGWSYAPVALEKLSQVFPQKCIQTDAQQGKPFDVNGVHGICNDCLLQLSGLTKLGKKWSLKLNALANNYEVWESDFDKNGEPDLAIRTPTGGSGYACSSRIMFIMFDPNRTPRVFVGYSTGLSTEKAGKKSRKNANAVLAGFQDICKTESGEAVVVLQSLERESTKGEKSYWRTAAWKAKNCNWEELHSVAGVKLPSYVRFTDQENNKPSPGMDYLGKNAASQISEIRKSNELEDGESFKKP